MKTMKTNVKVLGLISMFIVVISCSKEEGGKKGCHDPRALNYDASTEKGGTCQYSKMIFHAPGDQIGGIGATIDSIEISRDDGPSGNQVLIGTITKLNQDAPQNCEPPQGAVVYEFINDITFNFFTRYYLSDGTNRLLDTYTQGADPNEECIIATLTLP